MRALSLAVALLATPACFAQYESFPDVPDNHWAYVTLLKLKQAGMLSKDVILFRGGRPYDRMEIAMLAFDASSQILWTLERAEDRLISSSGSAHEIAEPLFSLRKEIADLTRMAALFSRELTKRHIDFTKLRTELKLVPQRLDVMDRNRARR